MTVEKRSLNERHPFLPFGLMGLGMVLILGAVLWSVVLWRRTSVAPTATPTWEVRIPYPNVPRVEVDEAKRAWDAGRAVFIDTRGEPYFSSGHIPGALSLTVEELPDRWSEIKPEAWIITYCT